MADALSRRTDLKPETKAFHYFLFLVLTHPSYQPRVGEIKPIRDLIKSIIVGYAKDKVICEIRRAIKKRSEPSWSIRETLKHRIIGAVHESIYGGHPGTDRTYLKLRADWYWPRMVRTIKKYIADCEDCRRNKPRLAKTPGLMEQMQTPDERWRSISMDFITDLSDTKRGHNLIWLVVDRLAKRAHFIATTKKVSAQEVTMLSIDNIWRLHMYAARYRIRSRYQVRLWFLEPSISKRRNQTQDESCFEINAAVNPSIKMSPFETDIGYVPHNPLTAVAESSRRGLRSTNAKVSSPQNIKPQFCANAKTLWRKLNLAWRTSTIVADKIWSLKWETECILVPKPYDPPTRLSRPHEVILHDGRIGQIVEAVTYKRKCHGVVQYLIRWVDEAKATWEPQENLHQMTVLIQAFEAKQPRRSSKRRRTGAPK
ncbi:unnamed protein product [Phytophthora fragariaefolia]|uniref:Unnamed protein product n=1 Tax=Phytophthora fragariaefolia TaxID=1490495 RepID=A0A9W6TZA0_9STRA|nr:unnamed protein product [Phytophthora fragariaefolia]